LLSVLGNCGGFSGDFSLLEEEEYDRERRDVNEIRRPLIESDAVDDVGDDAADEDEDEDEDI
ncbi:hypothetical protein BGZ65_008633, partial [Modicella reniformis]